MSGVVGEGISGENSVFLLSVPKFSGKVFTFPQAEDYPCQEGLFSSLKILSLVGKSRRQRVIVA